jgi:hypothetical protein
VAVPQYDVRDQYRVKQRFANSLASGTAHAGAWQVCHITHKRFGSGSVTNGAVELHSEGPF